MITNDIDPKLGKIIALAKQGVGGEKDAAIAIVRRICKEQGLEFDDVMAATDEREYMLEINFRGEAEENIIAQICWRFASSPQHPDLHVNRKAKVFFYTTTPSKHIETVNAAQVYLKAYRKERKKVEHDLASAFVYKHRLFRQYEVDRPKEPDAPLDIEKMERQLALARNMDNVTIHKTITDGS